MKRLALPILLLFSIARAAGAQEYLVPERPDLIPRDAFRMESRRVTVKIDGRKAEVKTDLKIRNVGGNDAEARFLFSTPGDAVIGRFDLFVGEKKFKGKIMPKEEARKIYEEIVRRRRDPALLERMNRGLFQTSVFPFGRNETKTVSVSYDQALTSDFGLTRLFYPLGKTGMEPGKTVLRVEIDAGAPLGALYSPSHKTEIERREPNRATVVAELEGEDAERGFELYYSTRTKPVAADVISYMPAGEKEGRFLLFLSPFADSKADGKKETARDIVFVLDQSGSMEGEKIQQARDALKFFVEGLRETDRFDVVTFSDGAEAFHGGLRVANAKAKSEVREKIEGVYSQGGTDILSALKMALKTFDGKSSERFPVVAFLTDGLPTVGETDLASIWREVKKSNVAGARLFSFGVGYDVNAALLDKLSADNRGATEYVTPGQNLEKAMSGFFARIQKPALGGPEIAVKGVSVIDLIPRPLPDLFVGGQTLVVGRYRNGGKARVTVKGTSGGKTVERAYEVRFAERPDGRHQFVENVWAGRRVAWLIDEIRLNGERRELVDEIVRLSVRYGIITEYTSFLAEEDRVVGFRSDGGLIDAPALAGKAKENFSVLLDAEAQTGASAINRAMSNQMAARAVAAPSGAAGFMNAAGDWETVDRVRNVRNKTFWNKKGVWRDAEAPADADPEPIRYYSDAFFKALNDHPGLGRFLSSGEAAIVQWDGKTWRFEP